MVPHKQFESEEIQNSVKKWDVDQITKTVSTYQETFACFD